MSVVLSNKQSSIYICEVMHSAPIMIISMSSSPHSDKLVEACWGIYLFAKSSSASLSSRLPCCSAKSASCW